MESRRRNVIMWGATQDAQAEVARAKSTVTTARLDSPARRRWPASPIRAKALADQAPRALTGGRCRTR